jgi:hypothetical protein
MQRVLKLLKELGESNMKTFCTGIAIAFMLSAVSQTQLHAASVPPEIKTTVAFVYVLDKKGEKAPNGTGFFVGVKDPNKKDYFVYFVTAKHVLQTPDRKAWLPGFFLRLNKKDGTSDEVPVPIILRGTNKTVYIHDDSTVDLAVIPMLPKEDIFDFKFLPDSMLTTKEDFKQLNIREGSEIFFTGLFIPYPGYRKNYPIVRFGRVALITEEKIEVEKEKMDLYLIESASFGGNSGSPVFFHLGVDRQPRSIIVGPPVIKIAGVMKGSFQEARLVKLFETANAPGVESNIGISAVIPAYNLHELLFGKELKKIRGF